MKLGAGTWDAYCAGEFNEARMVRLDREQRRENVAEMRQAGMSTRAIASGLGVSHTTVENDARSGGKDLPPERATPPAQQPISGLDGKRYQSSATGPKAIAETPPKSTPKAVPDTTPKVKRPGIRPR